MEGNFVRERITELRLKKGIAENRMSLDLGHSRSYMQSISSGRALPSMTEFLAICDYLEVSPKEFFNEESTNGYLLNKITKEVKDLNEQDLQLLLEIISRFKRM